MLKAALAALLLPAAALAADPGAKPTAFVQKVGPLSAVERVVMPAVDADALMTEDLQRPVLDLPARFAYPFAVDLTPNNAGTWEELGNGQLLWRLRVRSAGALSLNLGFTRYTMPPGGRLFLYSPRGESIAGPYTARDNADHGQLWTPVVLGDEVVIEVTLPATARPELALRLTTVGHDYRGFGRESFDALEKSGTCNVDTRCSVGEAWRPQIRSVARITISGSFLCTGFLVNNTARDFKPYFMTANHCGVTVATAPTVVSYWNYDNSVCRGEPGGGGTGDGPLSKTISGTTFRSGSAPSDFTLTELSQRPTPAFKVFWAGWDRSNANSTSSVGIHHPSGHTKRISFGNGTTITSYNNPAIPGDSTHVHVAWTLGVTEGGSSGSPLFTQDKRVFGQLHGGPSSCTAADKSDYYGRFFLSWTGGGTDATRLSNWLDPSASGVMVLDGAQRAPVPADWNGDGVSELRVYRNGAWLTYTAP